MCIRIAKFYQSYICIMCMFISSDIKQSTTSEPTFEPRNSNVNMENNPAYSATGPWESHSYY